jgi:hypothetical protein
MTNLQEMISLLPPITTAVVVVIAFLAAVIQLIDKIAELWGKLKPLIQYLILLSTQILPVGAIVWYYMYWAVQYHDRFTDRGVFLLLISEPTLLIVIYEMFWGTWLYPKLATMKKPPEEKPDGEPAKPAAKPASKKRK